MMHRVGKPVFERRMYDLIVNSRNGDDVMRPVGLLQEIKPEKEHDRLIDVLQRTMDRLIQAGTISAEAINACERAVEELRREQEMTHSDMGVGSDRLSSSFRDLQRESVSRN